MAKYTIIAEVGKALTNMLRDKLVPEPIDKPEKIGICEPKSRGEYTVGIHPYDIKEDLTSQKRAPIKLPDGREQDPPSLLELYYMISVSSKSEIEVKAAEESRIIGKIIQIFKDNQTIPIEYLNSDSVIDAIPISMIPLEMEEKVKIWTMFGESYKLSVFYIVGPVSIDSEIIRKPQPVETVILGTIRKIPKKIVQFETRITEEDIDDEYTQDYSSENEEEEDEDDLGSDDDFGSDDLKDDEDKDEENDDLDDLFDDDKDDNSDNESDDEKSEDDLEDKSNDEDDNEDSDDENDDDEKLEDDSEDKSNDKDDNEDSDDENNDDEKLDNDSEDKSNDEDDNEDLDDESNDDEKLGDNSEDKSNDKDDSEDSDDENNNDEKSEDDSEDKSNDTDDSEDSDDESNDNEKSEDK